MPLIINGTLTSSDIIYSFAKNIVKKKIRARENRKSI
jgi:hypothetical protein